MVGESEMSVSDVLLCGFQCEMSCLDQKEKQWTENSIKEKEMSERERQRGWKGERKEGREEGRGEREGDTLTSTIQFNIVKQSLAFCFDLSSKNNTNITNDHSFHSI